MWSDPEPPAQLAMTEFYAEHVHSHIHANPHQTLQKYRRRICSELAKFDISIEQLRDKTILDIGSGWQAIVFQELGCRQVYHLDINAKHVDFLNRYIAENGIKNIISEQADISSSLGSAHHIDLAFVAGVYHHLADREGFLSKLLPNMAANSDILFRVYRAGTWSRWLVAMLRTASIGRLTPEQLLSAYRLLHPYALDNQFVGDLIDDLLTPQWLAFRPQQFIADAERLQLKWQCSAAAFDFDFSDQDENFRVKWHIDDPIAINPSNRLIATGQALTENALPTPEIAELAGKLTKLLASLSHYPKRDAATVLVALYFLVRKHSGVDAYRGQIADAAPNPKLADWRIAQLDASLTYFRDWLKQ
ncbi:class I SAM-dependent methyltransferase [Methylomonas rosea]|uniref:Class I SAM-dependent methyltransferase n=1 Tax=Methylomonas rosea TaxID=2952227 RepID=A0ABT1TUI5_9GAMM|nr:class I SAM-dependent methyltransferase [Methylomonas sp. WSC-7]MCQ8118238.1 class I SAM-dependent methyltransferase [Methylomonas sp. WSC-7]